MIVDWNEFRRFHTTPLRWGEGGKSAIREPIAGAVDSQTGLLVMIGDDTLFDVFDPATMKSVGTVALPCSKTTFDVVGTKGRAWVGTKDGVVLPVDIQTRMVGDPLSIGPKGDVALALSASGRTLSVGTGAAEAQR